MQTRLVAALFETATEAQLAASDVVAAGVGRDAVSLVTSDSTTDDVASSGSSLGALMLPEADQRVYAEGLRGGGGLIAVRVEDARVDRVAHVLEGAGAVDIDARKRAWREAGWSDGDAPSEGRGDASRLQSWRVAGHGTGRVRSYTPAGEGDGERTVGDPEADSMGLNMSHPARHGGL